MNTNRSQIERSLLAEYGELMSGPDLMKCMGYKTRAAFNRAYRMGHLNVNIFEIPNRKGKFALTKDVVAWLLWVSGKEKDM